MSDVTIEEMEIISLQQEIDELREENRTMQEELEKYLDGVMLQVKEAQDILDDAHTSEDALVQVSWRLDQILYHHGRRLGRPQFTWTKVPCLPEKERDENIIGTKYVRTVTFADGEVTFSETKTEPWRKGEPSDD